MERALLPTKRIAILIAGYVVVSNVFSMAIWSTAIWNNAPLDTLLFPGTVPKSFQECYYAVCMPSFIAALLLGSLNIYFFPKVMNRCLKAITSGFLILGSLLLTIVLISPQLNSVLFIAAGILVGAGIAWALLALIQPLPRFSQADILKFLLLGNTICILPGLAFPLLLSNHILIVVCCELVLSGILIIIAPQSFLSSERPVKGKSKSFKTGNRYMIVIKDMVEICCFAGAIAFVAPFMNTVGLNDELAHSDRIILAQFAYFSAVLIFWLFRCGTKRHRLNIPVYIFTALLVFLLLLLPVIGQQYSLFLLFVGSLLFFFAFLLLLDFCTMSARKARVDAAVLFGLAYGTLWIMIFIGDILAHLLLRNNYSSEIQLLICTLFLAYIIIVETVFLFVNKKKFPQNNGTSVQNNDGVEHYAEIAERYHLSPREKEVMILLLRGNSIPAIAGMLFISENTVKTHTKKIYQQFGVHGKQELINLIHGNH